MKRILVLGGYGGAGRGVVERLMEVFGTTGKAHVIAAGRDAEKLEQLAAELPGAGIRRVDVTDPSSLHAAVAEADLVLNCVGPYIATGATIAEAALVAGVPYFDLASEQQHYRNLDALKDRAQAEGVLLLVGLGAYPGLSGLMLAALLDQCEGASFADMTLVTGHPADAATGSAVIGSALLELKSRQQKLEGGKLVMAKPGRTRWVDVGPPLSNAQVMEWPQLEVLAMAKDRALQNLSSWIAVDGQGPTPAALLQAVRLLPVDRWTWLRETIVAIVKARRRGPTTADEHAAVDWGAVRVNASGDFGSRSLTATIEGLGAATAWLPAFAVAEWLEGRLTAKGLRLPYQILDPATVIAALRTEAAVHLNTARTDTPLGRLSL